MISNLCPTVKMRTVQYKETKKLNKLSIKLKTNIPIGLKSYDCQPAYETCDNQSIFPPQGPPGWAAQCWPRSVRRGGQARSRHAQPRHLQPQVLYICSVQEPTRRYGGSLVYCTRLMRKKYRVRILHLPQ